MWYMCVHCRRVGRRAVRQTAFGGAAADSTVYIVMRSYMQRDQSWSNEVWFPLSLIQV